MIKTYVFDWSGVISDDTAPVYEANMMLLQDHGRDRISFDEWRRLSAFTAAGFLRNCGVECDENEVYQTYRGYFTALVNDGHKPHMIPQAKGTLDSLRNDEGKRLVVLSSHPEQNLRPEMKGYGVDQLFQMVIGSLSDKTTGLTRICQGLGVPGEEVLYMGDTIYDIRAAKAAGVVSGAVCTGYHTRDRLEAENPDLMLEHIGWMRGI